MERVQPARRKNVALLQGAHLHPEHMVSQPAFMWVQVGRALHESTDALLNQLGYLWYPNATNFGCTSAL